MKNSLQPFSPSLVQLLILSRTTSKYLHGTTIFEEGDLPNALYVLAEGHLKVHTRDEQRRELVFNAIGPGGNIRRAIS